jgi:hypothetical protein
MGARVVGAGGIVPGGWLAVLVGSDACGGWGATVGVAADVWAADVLTVASKPGTGCAVVVGIVFDIVADAGVASVGVNCCAGWADCSSATAVAAAAAIVARTTPARTIQFDHRLSSSGCASAPRASSSPSPADSATSSGSNR